MRNRFQLVFAICWGIAMTALFWLLADPDSPINLSSANLLNALAFLHIIPFIIATLLGGIGMCGSTGSDAIYWALVFAQWFVVGFGLSWIFCKFRQPKTSSPHLPKRLN